MAKRLVIFLAGGFWVACVGVPLLALFSRSWSTGLDPVVWAVARATLWQATLSTVFSVLAGFPLGLWAGRHLAAGDRPGRIATALLAAPYSVPTVVVAMAGVSWLGRGGVLSSIGLDLDWAFSLKAVVAAHVFLNAPWVAHLVAQARAQIPREQLEAARTLGAGPWGRFGTVIWPYVSLALASAAAQVLGLCAMSFALVLILGGGPPVQTLETEIYARVRFAGLDLNGAIACALVESVITLVPWVLVLVLQARGRHLSLPRSAPIAKARLGRWGGASLMGVAAIWLLPYLAVFAGSPWRVFSSPELRAEVSGPLLVSIGLALSVGAGTLAVAVVCVAAMEAIKARPWVQSFAATLLAVPSGMSVLVLGLGFWLAYRRWVDPFQGSFGAMVLLQITLFVPLAFRSLWPVARGTQRGLLEAARMLGASPWRAFWTVEWPRWRGPVVGLAAMITGAAMSEVAAVSLFYSEDLVPLPLLITRWFGQYRFEEANAVAAILMVLSAGTTGLIAVFGRGGGEEP